jgi:hypothetical protein
VHHRNDTGDKFATGITYTGGKFATRDDTGGKFDAGINYTGGNQRHRRSTLNCEYFREFSNRFETVLIGRGGQTPWLIGRPADSDSISDQWAKVQKIAIFRKNFRKDLNQNIDQSPDFCSKSSKDRNFSRKKKGFKSRPWIFQAP